MRWLVRNEFATVMVESEESAAGMLRRICYTPNRKCVWLDPLELEALTRLTRRDLNTLVDPSFEGLSGPRENGTAGFSEAAWLSEFLGGTADSAGAGRQEHDR